MSLEAMLDEERREVLALLDNSQAPRSRPPSSLGARSPSPYTGPRSPVRSMLDVGEDAPRMLLSPVPTRTTANERRVRTVPVRSMLDVDSPRPTPPPAQPIRSMLDVDGPPSPSAVKQVLSNPGSPTDPNFRAHMANQSAHPRSLSDAAARPADFGPRASGHSRPDLTSEYQFSGIITHHVGQPLPKRVSQGGKRGAGSMAEVMRGNDVSNMVFANDRGRHYSVAGPSSRLNNKSKSPQNRLDVRSSSPHNSLLSGRHLSPAGRPARADNPEPDYQNAYRHLSDANLARFGGSLSELARRKRSDDATSLGRLEKDYLSPDGELLPDDSTDDHDGTSSDDESSRGRKAARSFGGGSPTSAAGASGSSSAQSPKSTRKMRSQLAAAEEERTCLSLSLMVPYGN